jgi:hypothetical protein
MAFPGTAMFTLPTMARSEDEARRSAPTHVALKIKAAVSLKTLVTIYNSIRFHTPQD